MVIKPRKWKRGKSSCAYCGINGATDGDHVVPDCLYTPEARTSVKNMLTVPACRQCNWEKGLFDGPLQHYLLIDVDSSAHPDAKRLFDLKFVQAVSSNRVRMLDRFYEGEGIAEITANGIWLRDLYSIPVDFEPVRRAIVYLVRGLHFLVIGEVKREDEVAANVVERGQRQWCAEGFLNLGIDNWHAQGDVFTVAWVGAGAANVYWLLCFFDQVLFIARSAKSRPLHGPPSYTLP